MSKEQELIQKILDSYNGDNFSIFQAEEWVKEYAKEKAISFSKWNCEELWSTHHDMWFPYMDEDNPITGDQIWGLYHKSIESEPIIYDNKHHDYKDIRNLENED